MVLRTGYFGGDEQVPSRQAVLAAFHQAIDKPELLHAIASEIIAQCERAGNPARARSRWSIHEMAS
jgi:hypothetical protein